MAANGVSANLQIDHLSLINGNAAGVGVESTGGAIRAFAAATVTISNSTLSGNTAKTTGGAIHGAVSGTTILVNSTLSGNQAGTHGGGLSGTYGSIFQLNNSVIANSVADYDCWEGVSIYSLEGVNLIETQEPACSTLNTQAAQW